VQDAFSRIGQESQERYYKLGFKGMTVGGAQVSELHANFIINRGQASAADVLALIRRIRDRVKAEENIDLELEICVIGEEAAND
jgi:UDP-N-acetylmuramate dehydrogenase